MLKKTLLFLLILISFKASSQEHWEDEFWREEGKKRYAKTMSMAEMYTTFYSNGQIKWQGKCLENGTPDSVWVYYDDKGNKLWEGEYNGKYYEYKDYYEYGYDDGENRSYVKNNWDTTIIGNYKNGLKEGEWQEFDNTGKFIFKKGQFRNGEPTGIWQEFSEQTVETKILKAAEYNYATQKRILYKLDSIDGTEHIDSILYESQHGIKNNRYNHYNTSEGDVKLNLCFLGYGQLININPLNDFFYQKSYSKLSPQIQSIGFEWSGVIENEMYWFYNLNWTPAMSAQLNDSIRLRLSGYNTNLDFGYDFIEANAVDIAPTLGFGFQQLKLKVLKTQSIDSLAYNFNEGDYRIYRNSAPTVNAMLNLRFNIGGFTIGFAGGYVLDCSSPKWRYNGKFLSDSPKTSVSGVVANVSIGFHIKDY